MLDVDALIILNYLLRHREITAQTAAEICQRSVRKVSEVLNKMDVENHNLSTNFTCCLISFPIVELSFPIVLPIAVFVAPLSIPFAMIFLSSFVR